MRFGKFEIDGCLLAVIIFFIFLGYLIYMHN
jgi:hypothetical protein